MEFLGALSAADSDDILGGVDGRGCQECGGFGLGAGGLRRIGAHGAGGPGDRRIALGIHAEQGDAMILREREAVQAQAADRMPANRDDERFVARIFHRSGDGVVERGSFRDGAFAFVADRRLGDQRGIDERWLASTTDTSS